jgi:hypothetical protein
MAFHENVKSLKEHIDELTSIGQLKTFLLEKDLKLIVTIVSTGFACMDWNITERQVSGILELGMQMRLSNLQNDDVLLETRFPKPIHLDKVEPIDQRDLFDTLKQGIKTCIRKIC